MSEQPQEGRDGAGVAQAAETLTVTDNRTGRTYEVPITDGTVRAMDFRQMKVGDDDFGLMTYDPAFTNTASCRSAITYIDGDAGILEYRGYPIEQLAEQSSYLEVAYLLVHGELPSQPQLDQWTTDITMHTFVHENVKAFMQGFRHDAHPMGMLVGSVGALSTFYPDAKDIGDAACRDIQTIRLIAKMPTLAAFSYRHAMGQPYNYPDNDLSYAGNFLSMMYKMTELKYEPDPRLERALDILFILHADHEQNASTSAVRSVGSTQVDPYSAVAAGVAALYGPLHGGANEAVLRMLRRIGSTDRIPEFVEGVKAGNERLMGFGHRVYKNYDPRAKIIKGAAEDVFEVTGKNPLLEIAHRARADRARGRLLRLAQALPQRRLLLRPDLRGHGPDRGDVPGPLRDRPHERLDRPVARARPGQGAEDRPSAPDLHGRPRARLRADGAALAPERGGAHRRGGAGRRRVGSSPMGEWRVVVRRRGGVEKDRHPTLAAALAALEARLDELAAGTPRGDERSLGRTVPAAEVVAARGELRERGRAGPPPAAGRGRPPRRPHDDAVDGAACSAGPSRSARARRPTRRSRACSAP